jgi:hypothetical protein
LIFTINLYSFIYSKNVRKAAQEKQLCFYSDCGNDSLCPKTITHDQKIKKGFKNKMKNKDLLKKNKIKKDL